MNTDRNKLQRTTLEKIKKLNDLQKDELVDIVMAYTEKAISVIKALLILFSLQSLYHNLYNYLLYKYMYAKVFKCVC